MFHFSRYHCAESLLGYPIRRASASELLYGGVRVQYLVQKPIPLHTIKSEELPSPNLQRERHDLELEMSLPRDIHNYDNIHYNIQKYVNGSDLVESEVQGEARRQHGFSLSAIFGEVDHPELMHNSSARTYSSHDTRNILGYRVFPINIGSQWRGECIRIRTEDCLRRLKHAKLCALHGLPVQFPLPLRTENLLDAQWRAKTRKDNTLYEIDPNDPHKPIGRSEKSTNHLENTENKEDINTIDNIHHKKGKDNDSKMNVYGRRSSNSISISGKSNGACDTQTYAYLENGPFHPHPSKLSIFTRPADQSWESKQKLRTSKHHHDTNCDTNTAMSNTTECMNINKNRADTISKTKANINKRANSDSTTNKVNKQNNFDERSISDDELVESLFSRAMIQSWMPLQILKPKGNIYSPTLRGSGVRAPNMSLYQERLNRRGFGWKKKARSLWQQDIDTHGFRPERHY